MELSFFSCHHQYNPFLIQNKPFCSIATTRKRLPSKNLRVTQCNCSLSSSYDFSKPTSLTSDHEGRRALLTSLLTIAAAVHACDVAEAASTSRRALKASKIPESEFKALPNGLKYYDLKVGGGLKAVKGSRVAVHYVAKWKGITFMTSRQGLGVGGGTPYGFDVGQSERGTVLKGLDLGVEGMRVGGQRLLIVPPELAYGSKGVQEIPPNATIEIDIELLSIKESPFGSPVKIIEAYKIRLHSSGCKAFRSILNLDPKRPASQWEEGLEIQWSSPPEPICRTQLDCSGASKCLPTGRNGPFRCLCNRGYLWDHTRGSCKRKKCNRKASLSLKVSIAVISFVSLAAVIGIIIARKSSAHANQAKLAKAREDLLKSRNGGKAARMFQLKEVKKATNSFSKDRVLGSGGFGEVYKGELQDGTVVAVKSAKVGNVKSTQQVLNEVGILSQVNHKYLVRLLGCCVEGEQPLMIYEYISNGTLQDHLHGKACTFLDWRTRLRIALQTAEALAYLHSEAHTPIYHRDVKTTNILLDEDFNVKVADFGLSRLACPGLSHVSTCAQGTLGYLDPEYYRNYQLTDKSDVYSYGVVLLELLTSQKAIDFSRNQDDVNLVIYVSQQAKNDAIMEVIDQRLLIKHPSGNILRSMKLLSELAFACLQERKVDRPSMKNVVQQLECIVQIIDQEKVLGEVNTDST